MDFCQKYTYGKKGLNKQMSKTFIKDPSIIHKEKKKLTLLKIGIDQFTMLYRIHAKLWGAGPEMMVLHECMSTTMLNFQYAKLLGKITNLETDPLNPKIQLDYFNKYHLQSNNYWFEKTF